MKLHHISLLALTALAIPHASAATWDKTPGGIKAQIDSIEIEINYYTPSTVRVVKKPINKANTDPSLSVIATPEKMSLNVKKQATKSTYRVPDYGVLSIWQTARSVFSQMKAKSCLPKKTTPY